MEVKDQVKRNAFLLKEKAKGEHQREVIAALLEKQKENQVRLIILLKGEGLPMRSSALRKDLRDYNKEWPELAEAIYTACAVAEMDEEILNLR